MTSETKSDLPLAAEFPPATRADWMKLVDAALKGAPFDRKLVSTTYDGLRIEPLYERVPDARPAAGRSPAAPWQIMQRVDHPDPAAANAQALHDLENGATGLTLVFAGAIGSYGYGLAASQAAIERALDGIYLDAGIALEIDAGARFRCSTPRRRTGEAPRHRAGRDQHPLRARSARSERRRNDLRSRRPGVYRTVCGRRRPAGACGRRFGSAGARRCPDLCRRLSAGARSPRHRSRCRAQDDLLPAGSRRRSVSDDRQVPRAAQAVGASRGSVRASTAAGLYFGRDRLAHDDAGATRT